MALASCVAETVMSGLLAGCHAIVFDGSRVMNLDGFAAVPSASAELVELPIAFGDELVVYAIGAASCAVPGLPAALGELLGASRAASRGGDSASPRSSWRAEAFRFPRCTRARSRCSASSSRSSAAPSSSRATGARFARASSSTSPGSCRPSRRCRRGRGERLPRLDRRGAAPGRRRRASARRTSRRIARSGASR